MLQEARHALLRDRRGGGHRPPGERRGSSFGPREWQPLLLEGERQALPLAAEDLALTARVPVQCVGTKGSICSGELSIEAGGSTSEAPFSVTSGGRRIVSIPVSDATTGSSVVAVAKTAQGYGGYATATEVLRLR